MWNNWEKRQPGKSEMVSRERIVQKNLAIQPSPESTGKSEADLQHPHGSVNTKWNNQTNLKEKQDTGIGFEAPKMKQNKMMREKEVQSVPGEQNMFIAYKGTSKTVEIK